MNSISQVKQRFESVLAIRDDIESVFEILSNKLKTLKDIYSDIVKSHTNNEYSFGTDSFYFQNQLIETDFIKLKSMFVDIDNQIYCEYFNLYRMIKEYAAKDLTLDKAKRSTNFSMQFESFKRINSNKHYSISVVKEIHEAIVSCISEIEVYLTARESDLLKDQEQSKQGLNIDNLVYAEMYKNSMMKAKIQMFYQYMNAFNSHHNKYYTRLLLKVKIHHGIVNEDINIKQFVGVGTGTTVNELSKVEKINDRLAQSCTIDEGETLKIKSYIGYDNLPLARQSVINDIMSSAGSSSPKSQDTNEDEAESSSIKISESFMKPIENKIVNNNNNNMTHDFSTNDIGKKVIVDGYKSKGKIVFVGDHHVNKTLRIGVIFDTAVGKMNGTLDGHKYFECEEKMGLLTVPYKVKIC